MQLNKHNSSDTRKEEKIKDCVQDDNENSDASEINDRKSESVASSEEPEPRMVTRESAKRARSVSQAGTAKWRGQEVAATRLLNSLVSGQNWGPGGSMDASVATMRTTRAATRAAAMAALTKTEHPGPGQKPTSSLPKATGENSVADSRSSRPRKPSIAADFITKDARNDKGELVSLFPAIGPSNVTKHGDSVPLFNTDRKEGTHSATDVRQKYQTLHAEILAPSSNIKDRLGNDDNDASYPASKCAPSRPLSTDVPAYVLTHDSHAAIRWVVTTELFRCLMRRNIHS